MSFASRIVPVSPLAVFLDVVGAPWEVRGMLNDQGDLSPQLSGIRVGARSPVTSTLRSGLETFSITGLDWPEASRSMPGDGATIEGGHVVGSAGRE